MARISPQVPQVAPGIRILGIQLQSLFKAALLAVENTLDPAATVESQCVPGKRSRVLQLQRPLIVLGSCKLGTVHPSAAIV